MDVSGVWSESFEKTEGVIEVISGYSGGKTSNPTYDEVTYGNTGHFETVEVIFDKSKTNYKTLLEVFWINIDPFDTQGNFATKVIVIDLLRFIKAIIKN